MPTSHAEQLEMLLAKVMRMLAMHGDASSGDPGGASALTNAEGVVLLEMVTTGEATQQELASRLGLDKSRVSRLCAALERKGMLARQRDESNRRSLRLAVTPSGRSAADRLRRAWRKRHEDMLAAMSPDERRALLLGLRALSRELAASHGHGRWRHAQD